MGVTALTLLIESSLGPADSLPQHMRGQVWMVEAHPVPPVSNFSVDSIPRRILGTHDSHDVAVALMGSIEREAGRPDKVLAEEPELSRAGPERARKRVQTSEWHVSAVVVNAWRRNAHGCRGELRYRAIDAPKVARKSPVATQASRTALKYGEIGRASCRERVS